MTVNTQEAGDAPPGAPKTMVTDLPPAFPGRTLRTRLDSNKEGALGRAKFESQLGLLLTGSVTLGRYLTPAAGIRAPGKLREEAPDQPGGGSSLGQVGVSQVRRAGDKESQAEQRPGGVDGRMLWGRI